MHEHIDVNEAFKHEPDQAQQDLNLYLESRPYQDANGGIHSPDGKFVKTDQYFDEQYRIADERHHTVNESASKPYDDYSTEELKQALADAEQRQDKTSTKNITDALKENAERLRESKERPIREASPVQLAKQLARAEHEQDEEATEFISDVLLEKLASKEGMLIKNVSVNETDATEDDKARKDREREDHNARSDMMWNTVMKLKDKERKNLEKLDEMRNFEDNMEDYMEDWRPESPKSIEASSADTSKDKSAVTEPPTPPELTDEIRSTLPPKPSVPTGSNETERPTPPYVDESLASSTPDSEPMSDEDIEADFMAGKDKAKVEATLKEIQEARKTPEKFRVMLNVGEASKDEHGQDTILDREDLRLFGVFDGMGGHDNGAIASDMAARGVERSLKHNLDTEGLSPSVLVGDIKAAMQEGRDWVQRNSEDAGTTAVFAKVAYIDDEPHLAFANAGDSRLFIKRAESDKIEAITTDQSYGHTVYNGLMSNDSTDGSRDEYGVIPLRAGDRIMLCSDGITGDKVEDALTREEMQQGFAPDDPQDAADELLRLSKKNDDKSVLVIDIDTAPAPKDPLDFPTPVVPIAPPVPPAPSDPSTPPLPRIPNTRPSTLPPLSTPPSFEDDARDYDWPPSREQGNDSNLPPLTVKKGQMRKDVHDYMVANGIDPTLSNFMKIRQNIGLNTRRVRGVQRSLNPGVAYAWEDTEEGEEFTFSIAPEAFDDSNQDTLYSKLEDRVRQLIRKSIRQQ